MNNMFKNMAVWLVIGLVLMTVFNQFNTRQPLQPPVETMQGVWTEAEEAMARQMLSCSLVGGKASVAAQLEEWQTRLRADEIMAVSYIYDESKQYHSYRLFKEIASA